MGVGLSGNLQDFGIAEVFQLIGQQRKTGVLELLNSSRRVQLAFDNGAVVTAHPAVGRASDAHPLADMMIRCGALTRKQAKEAEQECRAAAQTLVTTVVDRGWVSSGDARAIEDLLTRNTIFDVLRWESGSFDFCAQGVEHERDPATLLGAEQILMDGLRMVDEWQAFAPLIPNDADVYQRVGRFESYGDRAESLSPEQLERVKAVFSMVDGRLTARRIIDLSRLGDFDGARILADLREAELIKPLHPEGVKQLRRHVQAQSREGTIFQRILRVAGVAFPLLALAVAVTYAGGVPKAPKPGEIERHASDRLYDAYATRKVRNGLDAYRFHVGGWPADLEELADQGFLDRDSLTAPRQRPYYSSRRADGVILLAPER